MKGEKDEGKQMVPLFPGLHISDGDKGGPKPPPRNKMALFEEYDMTSEGSKLGFELRSMLSLPPSNGSSSFVSQESSSSNVTGAKRKVVPLFATMSECPHSTEWYYSRCSSGVSGPANYQNPSSSANLMMKAKGISVQPPRGFSRYSNCCTHNPGDENEFAVPSYHGNLQLHLNKEKVATFSSGSLGKLHTACLNLPKETKSEDHTKEHYGNLGEENSRLFQNNENSMTGKTISELSIGPLQRNQHKKNSLGDERRRLNFHHARPECKILQKSKTVTDGMSAMSGTVTRKGCAFAVEDSHSSLRVGDHNDRTKIYLIKKCSDDKDHITSKVGLVVKREEISDTSMEGSILGLNLTPDEVERVIGQRLFLKARKTMVRQQKIFSLQVFELHRLILVQRLIARSPEILHGNNFNPSKPSIKFPPMNKLLYVSPLDPSPAVAKSKVDALKSNPGMDCGAEAVCGVLPLPTTKVEKGHLAQPLTPKPLPNTTSIPIDPKVAPWCFHPPPGNQWLVPVRSPSEGLIYKPYPGPCFPTVGIMAPTYGNCGPINISSLGGTSYGVPVPNEHGGGGFYGTELGQSYFQPYPMSLINASGSNSEVKQMIGVQAGELDKNSSTGSSNFFIPCQSSFRFSSQQSAVVSNCGGNLHKSKESDRPSSTETSPPERLEGDVLSLFPITPSLQVSKDQRNDQRVQAIKAVPHNRNSAPASAARIFQSIQEGRKKHE